MVIWHLQEDLLKELQDMEELGVEEQMLQVPAALPAAPTAAQPVLPMAPIGQVSNMSDAACLIAENCIFSQPLPPVPPSYSTAAAAPQLSEEEKLLRELQSSMMA